MKEINIRRGYSSINRYLLKDISLSQFIHIGQGPKDIEKHQV
jgi:hypothetical protein